MGLNVCSFFYCFHHMKVTYATDTRQPNSSKVVHPLNNSGHADPMTIPKESRANLKIPVCHHLRVKSLNMFI